MGADPLGNSSDDDREVWEEIDLSEFPESDEALLTDEEARQAARERRVEADNGPPTSLPGCFGFLFLLLFGLGWGFALTLILAVGS